jgi:hypothetical protein
MSQMHGDSIEHSGADARTKEAFVEGFPSQTQGTELKVELGRQDCLSSALASILLT